MRTDDGVGIQLGAIVEIPLARRDVPVGVVISEYLDVADAFYDKREKGFVNGLLDAIGKDVRAKG